MNRTCGLSPGSIPQIMISSDRKARFSLSYWESNWLCTPCNPCSMPSHTQSQFGSESNQLHCLALERFIIIYFNRSLCIFFKKTELTKVLRVLGIQCLHFWWKFHLTQTSFKHRYSVLQNLKSSGVLACTLWNHFYTNSTIKITIRNRYLLKTN